MKKLLLLLGVVTLVATCDRGPSGPDVDTGVQATVRAAPGNGSFLIGAVLLFVDAAVEEVHSSSARVLTRPDGTGTAVALSAGTPVSSLSFRLVVTDGAAPTITVLQVADGSNRLYPDPAAFMVELEED